MGPRSSERGIRRWRVAGLWGGPHVAGFNGAALVERGMTSGGKTMHNQVASFNGAALV